MIKITHLFTARKNERVQIDLEEQTNRFNQAKTELEKLKSSAVFTLFSFAKRSLTLSKAPVAKLENENRLLTADSEKFHKILQQYEGRKKKLIDTIAYEKAEITTGGKSASNSDTVRD